MAALTETDLLAFEADIEAEFSAGKIKAPIHLSGGNETQLINIFNGSMMTRRVGHCMTDCSLIQFSCPQVIHNLRVIADGWR